MARRVSPGWPTQIARAVVLGIHGALFGVLLTLMGRIGIVLALPLLLPLPGIWKERPYTFAWASLLLIFYVGGFLWEAHSHRPPDRGALALACASALEFVALMLYVRFRSVDQLRAMQAAAATAERKPASGDAAR